MEEVSGGVWIPPKGTPRVRVRAEDRPKRKGKQGANGWAEVRAQPRLTGEAERFWSVQRLHRGILTQHQDEADGAEELVWRQGRKVCQAQWEDVGGC